jgi:hypothetical protein
LDDLAAVLDAGLEEEAGAGLDVGVAVPEEGAEPEGLESLAAADW